MRTIRWEATHSDGLAGEEWEKEVERSVRAHTDGQWGLPDLLYVVHSRIKFGSEPIESIDTFELQTHVNDLAGTYSQDRVRQARSYLKSIFDEQSSKSSWSKIRPKAEDSQKSSAEGQTDFDRGPASAVLAGATRRDRLLLMLDMTDALRPSELFAIRWRTFDDENTLDLTETVYRGEIRSFGKTPKSLGKMHLPDDLAAELRQWKLECKKVSGKKVLPAAFMFPNADGGFMDTAHYRTRVLKPLADSLGIPKLNFQLIRRTIATRAQSLGSVKDI